MEEGGCLSCKDLKQVVIVGLYSQTIFPLVCDRALRIDSIADLRRDLLQSLRGDVLEIGFGSGLNLACYPAAVEHVTSVDPNPGMSARARQRIAATAIDVQHLQLRGEELPMAAASFENAVCTFTLCSIDDVDRALREIFRVLKPNGRLYLLEHGRSPDPQVRRWQARLTPIQKIVADGCRLNRDIPVITAKAGFRFESLSQFYLPQAPRWLGSIFQGIARKRTDS